MKRIFLTLLCALCLWPCALQAQDQPNGANTTTILSSDSQNSVLLKLAIRAIQAGGGGGGTTASPATASTDPTDATVTTTSATVLTLSSTSKNATIYNTGSTAVRLGFGAPAVSNGGFYLPPGAAWGMNSTNLTTGIVTAITASGTSTLAIHEGH